MTLHPAACVALEAAACHTVRVSMSPRHTRRRVAFTGGMNIGDEYGSPRAQPGQKWRDTHVRVEGPTAWEMAVVFAEGWGRAGGRPFDIEPLPAEDAPLFRLRT